MTAPVAHDARHLAEQAEIRHGLRLAGLPLLTSAGEDYARAWDALTREAEIDAYLSRGAS